mgnify:CR=1 FL=1|tara:strand:+ start:1894 stop:2370 length:477 start_codon:yes stop_codon:yes gene_type:complete
MTKTRRPSANAIQITENTKMELMPCFMYETGSNFALLQHAPVPYSKQEASRHDAKSSRESSAVEINARLAKTECCHTQMPLSRFVANNRRNANVLAGIAMNVEIRQTSNASVLKVTVESGHQVNKAVSANATEKYRAANMLVSPKHGMIMAYIFSIYF